MLIQEKAVLAAAGSLLVQTGNCTLWTINVNTPAPGATLTVYDNTSAAGTSWEIDCSTPGSYAYGVRMRTGIFVVMAGGDADVTIGYA